MEKYVEMIFGSNDLDFFIIIIIQVIVVERPRNSLQSKYFQQYDFSENRKMLFISKWIIYFFLKFRLKSIKLNF